MTVRALCNLKTLVQYKSWHHSGLVQARKQNNKHTLSIELKRIIVRCLYYNFVYIRQILLFKVVFDLDFNSCNEYTCILATGTRMVHSYIYKTFPHYTQLNITLLIHCDRIGDIQTKLMQIKHFSHFFSVFYVTLRARNWFISWFMCKEIKKVLEIVLKKKPT